MNTAPSATLAIDSATVEPVAIVDKKAKAPRPILAPSLGDYLIQVLSDAKSQMGLYESKLPPATLARVRNGKKSGLKITSIRDAIADTDEHGKAYLVSAKTAEAIELALVLAQNLSINREAAKVKARKI